MTIPDSSSSPNEVQSQAVMTAARDTPVFRQIAISHAAGSQIGEALDVYWAGMRVFTLAAFLFLAAMLAFLALVEFEPTYRMPAFTDTAGGLIRLSAIEDARITRITIEEGATVEKGAVLAVLDTDRVDANGSARGAALVSKLHSERAMLAREVAAARSEARIMRDLANRKVAGLRRERASLISESLSNEHLLTSLRSQSARIAKTAANGYVPQIQADQKRDEVSLQESKVASAHAAISRIDWEIDATNLERQLTETRLATIIENRDRSSGELDRQAIVAQGDASQIVTSPEAGVVSSSLVSRGQSVMVGQTLFTIAPRGEPLVVRVLVPARVASVIRPGMTIRVVFRAYPEEIFGKFEARVERVSDAPLMPADLPEFYRTKDPSFIAVATLSDPICGPNGERLVVKAGMLANALVPLERRSAVAWLLEPILRGFNGNTGGQEATQGGGG